MVAVSRHLGRRIALRLALREIYRVVPQMAEARPAAATLLRLQQILICECAPTRSSFPRKREPRSPEALWLPLVKPGAGSGSPLPPGRPTELAAGVACIPLRRAAARGQP